MAESTERKFEVANILNEVCEILGVQLGPGLARYVPLIAKAREAAAALRSLPATAGEPVIRCRDCGASLLWEKSSDGYEVIHSCKDGEQVREMFEEMSKAAQPSAPAPQRCFHGHTQGEPCYMCTLESGEPAPGPADAAQASGDFLYKLYGSLRVRSDIGSEEMFWERFARALAERREEK